MSADEHGTRVQIIVAVLGLIGVLGGALIANWDKIFPPIKLPATPTSAQTTPQAPEATVAPTVNSDISGGWRDETGAVYDVKQHGNSFEFTAWNQNIGIGSQGHGTISGRQISSEFYTTVGSTGSGTLTLSTDGTQIIGSFRDSRFGIYSRTLSR